MHPVFSAFPVAAPIKASVCKALDELWRKFRLTTQAILKCVYVHGYPPRMQGHQIASTNLADIKAPIPSFQFGNAASFYKGFESLCQWLYEVFVAVDSLRNYPDFKFLWNVKQNHPFIIGGRLPILFETIG